jgi:hypothetical protein
VPWVPDPTGRHQHRWHDGTSYTRHVADGRVTSIDYGAIDTAAPPSHRRRRRRRRWPIVLGVLVIAGAAAGGAWYLFLRDDDGFGTSDGSAVDGEPGRHDIEVSAGSVVVVTARPDADLDAAVGFEVTDITDEDVYDDLFGDRADELLGDDGAWFALDAGFAGDVERTVIVAPEDVTGTVVVRAVDGTEGDYEVTIERFDLDIDERSDLEDVLEAVAESPDVPDDLRDLYDSLLALEEGDG